MDSENITFAKEGRQINRSVRTLNAPAKVRGNETSNRTIVNLTLADANNTDRTRVVINENAQFDYETDKDAPKFMSSENSVPQIYTISNGVDFAINERPMGEGSVMLGVHFGAKGQYTIALENEVNVFDVVLEDKMTGKMTTLNEGEGYSFSTEAGNFNERFVLHFNNSITGVFSTSEDNSVDNAYYTIDGIRISKPTQRGIYIHNNQKIIVK